MSVEFFTGFEGCSTTAQMDEFLHSKGSASHVYLSLTNGWDNGKCITWTRSVSRNWAWFSINCEAGKTKVIGWHTRGFGSQPGYDSRAAAQLLQIRSGTSQIVEIFYSVSEGIQVYRTGTLIASDNTVVIDWSFMRHVEVRIVSHVSEGSVQIKLDQEFIFEAFNLNTSGTDITRVYWGAAWGYPIVWDNIFIADEWQGSLKSHFLIPSADALVEFTPSEGADNYELIHVHDGDSNYVESAVLGEQDLYEFAPDIPLMPVAVVLIAAVAKRTETIPKSLDLVIIYDGVEYVIGSTSLETVYQTTCMFMGADPLDEEWPSDLINSMTPGFRVA